ncbi:1,4-dihydroxy-2-naphthoate prenyltransferase [Salinibacterium sp. UTAS2018]|uniref:UbiA family prenyltransferase n=1 Tax=Salinibacterium sp. UTAS2018 TaxID=2508880 RepID=UPI0010097A61|nr:UbiA family prenyltransferase [Salinibacterium sp. UTAS2018]QAV69654.1 1,4-dihydroxy-2-naphthoate prenyltransferase [Salinibacterium sp. UTAS2018]
MMRALARSSHPGPTAAVTTIVLALAWGYGLEGWRIAVVTVMILSNQLSVGLSNDWLDAERDRSSGRTDKPVVAGEVSTGQVASVAIGLAATSVVLSVLLGPLAAVAHAIFLASGWLYNVGLKSTVFSVAPYIAGFGALPAIVTLAGPTPQLAAPWAITAGALLGIAAHFTNVLPDLEDDSSTGVRGLPHVLGARLSAAVIAAGLIGAGVAVVFGPGVPPNALALIGFGATVAIAAVCVVLIARGTLQRLLFRLTIAAAAITAALLVLSAPQLS